MTLQQQIEMLRILQSRRAVLRHLIEYLDSNFRPVAGQRPKLVLLTDEKLTVPDEIFDAFVSDMLVELKKADEFTAEVLASTIEIVKPPPAPPQPPAEQTPQPQTEGASQ